MASRATKPAKKLKTNYRPLLSTRSANEVFYMCAVGELDLETFLFLYYYVKPCVKGCYFIRTAARLGLYSVVKDMLESGIVPDVSCMVGQTDISLMIYPYLQLTYESYVRLLSSVIFSYDKRLLSMVLTNDYARTHFSYEAAAYSMDGTEVHLMFKHYPTEHLITYKIPNGELVALFKEFGVPIYESRVTRRRARRQFKRRIRRRAI